MLIYAWISLNHNPNQDSVLIFDFLLSEKGRKRMQVIPKGRRTQWQSTSKRYRRVRRSRAQLVKLFAPIIKLVDELERERTVPPPL